MTFHNYLFISLEEKYRNSVLAKFAIRSSPSDPETTTRI